MLEREKIITAVNEFRRMKAGQSIENPEEKMRIVGKIVISRKSLKHFVEQRMAQNADIDLALQSLIRTIKNPEILLDNNHKTPNSFMIGKQIPRQKKALMIVLTLSGEIITLHFRKINTAHRNRKMKDHSFASRGAAYPSSFSPQSGDLAASLSALQKQNSDL